MIGSLKTDGTTRSEQAVCVCLLIKVAVFISCVGDFDCYKIALPQGALPLMSDDLICSTVCILKVNERQRHYPGELDFS